MKFLSVEKLENGLRTYYRVSEYLRHLQPFLLLALRAYIAWVFWRSGWTKLADWESTVLLFTEDYHVPLLPPDLAAVLATVGELGLSFLLLFGFLGRFAALGLSCVNAVAVISYPALWAFDCPAAIQSHAFWAVFLAVLLAFGPGCIAVDAWVKKRLGQTCT